MFLPTVAHEVPEFWFGELTPMQWFKPDPEVDRTIADRFGVLLAEFTSDGVPPTWLESAKGRLAAVIVLDQFPRNIHRGTPGAFATDQAAFALADEAITLGLDEELSEPECTFLYMPFQHIEDAAVQNRSVALYTKLGNPDTIAYSEAHRDVIGRYGRFPHRNTILGRVSTADEEEYLAQPDAGF